MNSYIISGKGFFVDWSFDHETKTKTSVWSERLREAKNFNSSSARKLIANNNLEAFIWQPKREEAIVDMYRVVKEHSYDYGNEKERIVQIWVVQKVKMESKSDVKFLMGMEKNNGEYLDYKTAVEVCNEKNMELLANLKEKLNIIEI